MKRRRGHRRSEDYSSWDEWARDFYSGYMYDPDGKLVDYDCSMSVRDFLAEIDGKIAALDYLSDEEAEKLVSRLLQWKNRVCDEANLRFVKLISKFDGI